MAYMTKNGFGPYPNKTGEYCGNHLVGSPPILISDQNLEKAKQQQKEHLKKMRFGRPRSCESGTSQEMEIRGWVGLYLIKDSTESLDGDIEVPTPQELMEPNEK